MKPIIGITCKYDWGLGQRCSDEHKLVYHAINKWYVDAVAKAGGVPVLLPTIRDKKMIKELAELVDGLLFSGGGYDILIGKGRSTIGTSFYRPNPDRMHFSMDLMKYALKKDMPIFGICLGHQTINEALGGSLDIDITHSEVKHNQREFYTKATHPIEITKPSFMYNVFRKKNVIVNSHHCQAIKKLGKGLIATSHSSDGCIESIESTKHSFVHGVQFHPESLVDDYAGFSSLFKELVRAAKRK
ncbi:hypothetical protein COV93_04170 [Candidatus Woesearchaeota archaeon CG11_big_fil_rev_8_21_14_0_20_43_8]|nr:MAG: hypothetical protein COV93_04170 [Candidatus Woesearchaeota archaeon CG11_big_fil_rev_8_21_14_0_20_43_8]PIO05707.1 MAG: hypothetical protein COT47_03650 [Candidatus Woesearchaeota archaeon CG08_land_8_20_14_0_20_43_7]